MSAMFGIMRFICGHRIAAASLAVFLLLFSVFAVSSAHFRENIFDLLPESDEIIDSHIETSEVFRLSDTLYFNVSGSSAEDASERLAQKLQSCGMFEDVFYSVQGGDLDEGIISLVSASSFLFDQQFEENLSKSIAKNSIKERMEFFKRKLSGPNSYGYRQAFSYDVSGVLPVVLSRIKSAAGDFGAADSGGGRLVSADGKNFLVLARGKVPSSDSAASSKITFETSKIVSEVSEEFPGSKISWCGGYRMASDNASIAREDSQKCLAATLAIMVVLCLASFRRRWFAPIALVPSLFGTALAFGTVSLFFDSVSTIAVAFAGIAIGVSIDYAVHILYRLDASDKITRNLVCKTSVFYAKPVAIVAGTTTAAFVIMFFSGSAEFAQLGAFGAAGVVFSALASVFLLPAFVLDAPAPRGNKFRFFERAANLAYPFLVAHRRGCALLAAALTALAIPFAAKLGFDGRISSFNGVSSDTACDDAIVRSVWGGAISQKFIVVYADTPDEARSENIKLAEFLSECGLLKNFNSLSGILPDKNAAAGNKKRWNAFWQKNMQTFKGDFRSAALESGINFGAFKRGFSLLEDSLSKDPPDLSEIELVSGLTDSRTAEHGRKYWISTLVELSNADAAGKLYEALKKSFPDALYIDMDFMGSHICKLTSAWMLKFCGIALAVVSAYLVAMLRSVRAAAAVLAPVIFGLVWSFAIMAYAGASINLINVIFVIFAVCVAQDYGVFFIFDSGKSPVSTLAAVAISATTTVAAFGTLAFAQHPVLKSLGVAASVSILSIFTACVLLAPFMKTYFQRENEEK